LKNYLKKPKTLKAIDYLKSSVLFILLFLSSGCKTDPPTPSELYSKYESSVVLIRNSYYIKASVNNGLEYYFTIGNNGSPILQETERDAIENAGVSHGTGFFISGEGEIATNRHVIHPSVDLEFLNNEINNNVKEMIVFLKESKNKKSKDFHSLMELYEEYKPYLTIDKRLEVFTDLNRISDDIDKITQQIDDLVFNPDKTKVEIKRIALGVGYNNSFITKDEDYVECVLKKKSNNEEVDLAIIQLKNKQTPERVTDFFDISNLANENIELSDKVYIIGYNQGFALANTKEGIKSQLNEGVITQEPDNSRLLYSIPTLPGSSGSPVFNKWGHLIGVNYAKIQGSQGFSFGVPAMALAELHNTTDYQTQDGIEKTVNHNSTTINSSRKVSEILYGFKLGQYYECIDNTFGEPDEVVNDEKTGVKKSAYLLSDEKDSYIVFETYKMRIESIQLFSLSNEVNPTFRDVKMGENKNTVIKYIGEPTEIIGNEIGGELLKFENTNYDVEINKGKLSSIRIWNDQALYEKPKKEDIPTMEHIKNLVLSGENERISKILSTGIEYNDDEKGINYFEYSWNNEIKNDYSRVYEKVKSFVQFIKDKEYEENLRIIQGESPLIVYKFEVPNRIVEIVLKMEYGKYLIWEINNVSY